MKLVHWVLLALFCLGLALAWWLWPRAKPVDLLTVERRRLAQVLDEDGVVRSWVEVSVASQVQGRLKRLAVARGEKVAAGQLLAELDGAEQRATLDQLLAQERAAARGLQQSLVQADLTRRRVQAELDVARAGVQVAQAQQNKLEAGPRSEQRLAVKAVYDRARQRIQETRRDLQRRQYLFDQGATSRSDLENFQAAQRNAESALREAEARWREVETGPVSQDRRVARAEVARSEANLQASSAGLGQAEVAQAAAAEAGERLEAVRAQVRQARTRLEQLQLRSPAAGVVEFEQVEVGELVSPGQVVLRISDPGRIYVELLLDEGDRAQARLGAGVQITSDAYPGQVFPGTLKAIESQAFLKRELRNSPTQDEDRVFRARVAFKPGVAAGMLFPGMSVFAQVVLAERNDVLTIPRGACINREGDWVVFKAEGGRARRQVVEIGQKDNSQIEITKGLARGDRILANPGGAVEGMLIR
ncbi:efflux RND transporter periplasmic adaptor subunit [bacterium]|nr:efflux RND transporter periplasmic adaptor subunit [bacterium]